MAKNKKATPPTGKLAGKTVAFVGKFGYRDMHRSRYEEQVVIEGGSVVNLDRTVPDFLFVGEGRGGKPPAEVAKTQKVAPAVTVLDTAAFLQFLLPDPERLMHEIGKGRRGDFDRFWDAFDEICRRAGTQINLCNADLRKADLYGAKLEGVELAGADCRDANTEYTHFGDLDGVNFEDCIAKNVYLQNLKNCSFRRADLEKAWMFYGNAKKAEACDFTAAKMSGARAEGGTLTDCNFASADLSDAQIAPSVFVRADFSQANMSRVHASGATFESAIFVDANLHRADLRKASLLRADLRNANLREAVLSDADLTGANVDGADFQDAVLTAANLAGLDVSKAKNFKPPVVRVAGPKLLELAAATVSAKEFMSSAEVDLGTGEFALLAVGVRSGRVAATSTYRREGNEVHDRFPAPTFEQGLLNLADRWTNSTLRLDSVQAKGSKTIRGQKLLDLATEAWAEAFGVAVLSPAQLKAQRDEQETAAWRERDDLMQKIRKEGPEVWNSLDYRLRDRIDLQGIDLSGADLTKLSLWGRSVKGASFAGSNLKSAELWNAELQNVVFTGANLENCSFQNSKLNSTTFRDANLSNANLVNTKLLGVDFTGATLKDASFDKAQFDHTTIFPADFNPPDSMIWKGDGPRPGTKKVKAAKAGSIDFETFLQQLNNKVELARMEKAGSMLKAERFQLFAEVKDDSLAGIVKSQSNKDLVYSCRLTSNGAFGCCTQNLRPCGGLRGALCKHLLVLIVGLAKAAQLDAATVNHWIDLSRSQKPAIDEDAMSATFLRYKGAEAGEVDWRPTETIPEDFYAM
jgi:uncharacterized protein YjbI with pentapeptide repeats